MIVFGVIYFIGFIFGCCVLWLHNNFDYTLTPLIISLNILISTLIGREIYKKSKKDLGDCIMFSILNAFLLLCLIFSDRDSSIFLISLIHNSAITFSLFVAFLLYKIKNT